MNSASLSAARAFIAAILLQCWKPRVTGSVWRWAEANVVLSQKQSAVKPGPYRAQAYARMVMDFINDPDWDELVIQKSSQTGITEAILNIIRYLVAEKPMPVLYVTHSQAEVKKVAKMRLEPSIRDFLPDGMGDILKEGDMQTMFFDLPHMTIYFEGGHSSGALSGKTAGLGVVDEMDEHPPVKEGEMENSDKMRERVKLMGKLILLGRPTTEKGLTHREYKTGTCDKLMVP